MIRVFCLSLWQEGMSGLPAMESGESTEPNLPRRDSCATARVSRSFLSIPWT